jgi:hypothetical protein
LLSDWSNAHLATVRHDVVVCDDLAVVADSKA